MNPNPGSENPPRKEPAQSTALQLACGRLLLLGVVFVMAYGVVAVRVIDLMIVQSASAESVQEAEELARLARSGDLLAQVRRGNIYDRNGVLLATSLKTPALYADPALILDKPAIARALSQIFPELKEAETLTKISVPKSRYAWLRPNLSPAQQDKVLELGEPGLAVVVGVPGPGGPAGVGPQPVRNGDAAPAVAGPGRRGETLERIGRSGL